MVIGKPVTRLPSALPGETSAVLLVVAAAEEVAKRIESHLRNAGHPLRVAWITELEVLQDVLQRNPPNLVLCDENVQASPLRKVLELSGRLRPDVPVVVIGNGHTIGSAAAALAGGAQDFASYADLQQLYHLELVVLREIVKHQQLRELRLTQLRLADFESRHRQLTAGTADAVAQVQEGIVANANPAFTRLLGYDDPAELSGQPLIDLVAADQQAKIKERLRAVQKGRHDGEPLELALVGRKGQVQVKAQLILGTHEGENVIELLIRAEAGKGQRAAAQTALHGRSAFGDALAQIPADDKTTHTAMLLRIDAFDALEQRIGYADAQHVASLLAETVHSRLAPQDQSFVFSVEELALLVQRPDYDGAEQFAEFLRKEVSDQIFSARQHEAHIGITVTVFPLGSQEAPEQVIRQLADEARKISAKGGNRIVVLGVTAKANQVEREEARRAGQVNQAIKQNRLKLAYQSIASLEGESRSHFDVLVRMLDETGKELHAAEFVPSAQKFGLMRSIDRWVVTSALGIIAKRVASTEAAVLFVKLSEDTLKDSDAFIAWLAQTLQQPLRSDEIVFEIQEVVVQNHVRKARALTQALREMGAGIAIEHFGVGASSVQLLDHLPVNFIKFHPSFTQKFGEKDTQKRLGDLLEAAKQRKLKTIVCHVEDANLMARLWQMGVNFIQGYHVQEPEVVLLSSDIGAGRR